MAAANVTNRAIADELFVNVKTIEVTCRGRIANWRHLALRIGRSVGGVADRRCGLQQRRNSTDVVRGPMSPRVASRDQTSWLHDSASGLGSSRVRRCLCRRSSAVDHRSLIRYPYVDVDVDVDSRSDDDDDSALSSNDDDSAISPDHDDSTEATLDHHHVAAQASSHDLNVRSVGSARFRNDHDASFNHHAANDDVDASGDAHLAANNDVDASVPPTTLPPTTVPPKSGPWWTPSTGVVPWQWEIGQAFDVSSATDLGTNDTLPNGAAAPAPQVYDIDGIDNSAATVSALQARGAHVICYMEVGTAGNYGGAYTTYYNELQAAGDLGSQLSGYPEYFININAPSAVAIVESILSQQCAAKGFDAVETDLDETFNNNEGTTGFTITQADEEAYLTTLANYMHGLGWDGSRRTWTTPAVRVS